MNRAEYEAIEAVNWSTLKHMLTSPAHYWHELHRERTDSPAFRLGRAVHAAILEPDRFAAEWTVYEGTRRGKAWDEFRAECCGEVLTRSEHDQAVDIARSVFAHPAALSILARGEAETVHQWTDKRTGIACKGILDWHAPGLVMDVKTAATIERRQWVAAVARYHYAAQMAFYRRAVGDDFTDCVIVAVEKSAPFDVGVFRLDRLAMNEGDRLVDFCLDRLVECRKSGKYPGRYPELEVIGLPEWAVEDVDEEINF